jgi:hypothetical protein
MPRGVRSMISPTAFSITCSGTSPGAMGIGIDRQRLGHADRVAQLDGAALGQAGGHDVLGQVARGIGRRTVHLGRVLAGKRAAAMGGRAAIGVDDDLAPGQARIAIGATDDELAGRVDVPLRLLGDPALGQHLADIGLHHGAHIVGGHVLVQMLRRQHDRSHLDRLAAFVAHGQLAFGVRAQRRLLARFAHLGQAAQDRGHTGSAPASGRASRPRRSRT